MELEQKVKQLQSEVTLQKTRLSALGKLQHLSFLSSYNTAHISALPCVVSVAYDDCCVL